MMTELTMCMAGAILLLVMVNAWCVRQIFGLRQRWGDLIYAALKDDGKALHEAMDKLLLHLYQDGYDRCGCPWEVDEDHDCDIVKHAPPCPLAIAEKLVQEKHHGG